ncbi:MAG: serine protease [Planctomycetota bacterium]
MSSFYRHTILALLTVIGLMSVTGDSTVSAAQRSIAGPMATTFRIRSQEARGNAIVTGHGTAFAIDLSEFGYGRKRYLMTACHVVKEKNGQLAPNLRIEMRTPRGVRWARVRVLSSDVKMDVALLECETDLPHVAKFCQRDVSERNPLVMIGSPAGVPLRALKGFVRQRKNVEPSVATVEYIQEGCSGGPIFDANSQTVAGLCIAGIGVGKSAKMDPHTCLYVSVANMKRFLRASLKLPHDGVQPRRNGPSQDYRNDPNYDTYASPNHSTPKASPRTYARSAVRFDRTGMMLP